MTQYVTERVERLENPVTAWALLGMIVASILAYGIFINGIIANTVAAKESQAKANALTSSVSSLESAYLAAKADITLDSALAQGFSPASSDVAYVSKASAASLSFNR